MKKARKKRLKKISLCFMVSLLLVGCGNGDGSAVQEPTKNEFTSQSVSEDSIIAKIDDYELTVYGSKELERVIDGKIELEIGELDFKGYPENVEIVKDEKGFLEVKSLIKNDFFVTDIPVTIVYEHSNNVITKATVEDKTLVKPVEPFDFEMFYDTSRNIKLQYKDKVDAENALGYEYVNTEISITKENIESIEYAFNVEFPNLGINHGGTTKSDFSHSTYILFTLKDGEKYLCHTRFFYKPYETNLYNYANNRKSPIWDIELGSAKKVE